MDDATKKLVMGMAAGALRKLAIFTSGVLTTHGIAVTGSFTETFVSAGLGLGVWAYSTYGDYVKVILHAKFEVWKATALAQAEALHKASVPAPTAAQIADKSPNPSVTAETVAKVMTAGCVALFAVMLFAGPALAQGPIARKIQQDIAAKNAGSDTPSVGGPLLTKAFDALAKPFRDLADFIGDDLDAAIALSTAIPELQDGHGQQCWMAMSTFGKIVKAHPLPLTLKAATDFEALRLHAISANRLCGDAHCTQMFADGVTMAQAASPVPLVGVPQLHDLCAKIPQIALVDPVAVPAKPVSPQ